MLFPDVFSYLSIMFDNLSNQIAQEHCTPRGNKKNCFCSPCVLATTKIFEINLKICNHSFMIKRFIFFCLLLVLCGCPSDPSPHREITGNISTACFELDVNDPGIITGYKDSIGKNGENPCPKQVIISDGIRKIANRAFAGKELQSVVIPMSVSIIGDGAFADNADLATVHIPNPDASVPGLGPNHNGSRNIFPNGYFIGGTSLSCFEYTAEANPKNSSYTLYVVTNYAGGNGSVNCPVDVVVPKGFNIIGPESFKDKGISSMITLASIQEVRPLAFVGNPDLAPVYVKYFFTPEVAENAFPNGWYHGSKIDCYEITGGSHGEIIITDYEESRKDCPNRITIPYGVTRIGSRAFEDSLLIGVTLSETVTHIDYAAFYFNQNLETIIFPSSVIHVGNYAFASSFVKNLTLNEGLETIGSSAFSGNELTSLTIPASVTSIGASAFASNKITTIDIPENITSMENGVFEDNLITSVNFNDSLTSIGSSAFEGNLLTTVTIPDSTITIGASAFRNNNLESVTLGSAVTTIEQFAFSDDLGPSQDPSNPTVFSGDNRLTTITLPNTLSTIGNGAFFGNAITSISLPDSVSEIHCDVFRNNNLSSASFGTGVSLIGPGSFLGNSLTAAVLPNQNVSLFSTSFDSGVSLTTSGGESISTDALPSNLCVY